MSYIQNVFITVSDRHDLTAEQLKRWEEYSQKHYDTKHILFKEMGKNGEHPHYHFYGKLKTAKRSNALKSQFITMLFKDRELDRDERKHLVVFKKAYDEIKLIGGYCTKESDYKIQFQKNIDIVHYKKEYERRSKEIQYTRPIPISLGNAPFLMNAYMTERYGEEWTNRKSLGYSDTSSIIKQLIQDGYSAHTLLKSIEDITFALKCILKIDELVFTGHN